MPLTAAQQAALSAAIDRLQNYYDGDNPYNPATNPGGFRQGGQVVNFEPALKDTATVMNLASILVADATAAAINSPKAVRVDSAQTFSKTELAQVLANIGLPSLSFGQCQFQYVSATQCKLVPLGGGALTINGNVEQIPSAGVTVANMIGAATLTANTLYYAYAYMAAGAMVLEWSTTAFALDARGCPIKAGDPTRTCVGMAYANAASQFADTAAERLIASYFNRRTREFNAAYGAGARTGSTSFVPITGTARLLSWGDVATSFTASGYANNDNAGGVVYWTSCVWLVDTFAAGGATLGFSAAPHSPVFNGTLALGLHTASVGGCVQNAASGAAFFMSGSGEAFL